MLGTLSRSTAVVFATTAAAVVAVPAMFVAAAPARAATVSMLEQPPPSPTHGPLRGFLMYRAFPGEVNSVRLAARQTPVGHRLLVSDQTAPLVAGPGCTQVDDHSADCSAPQPPGYAVYPFVGDVSLGDGDDSIEVIDEDPVSGTGTEAEGLLALRGDDGNDRVLIWPVSLRPPRGRARQ